MNLAERLLSKIAEISRRSDVVLHRQSLWRTEISPKWQRVLPPDMFAFFSAINGVSFYYSFKGEEEAWHGFNLLHLREDGKGTFTTDPPRGSRAPRMPAKKYVEHFFQPGEVPPDTQVLFFSGSDDAWGLLMLGEGESATFRSWDNDGFTHATPKPSGAKEAEAPHTGGAFTEIIERLIAHGFAHTWNYATHPDTDAVVARLATPVASRQTFELRVKACVERSEGDYRRVLCEPWQDYRISYILGRLGLSKAMSNCSRDEKIEKIVATLEALDGVSEVQAKSIMKELVVNNATKATLAEYFAIGKGPLVEMTLVLEYLADASPIPLAENKATLVRALHDIEGLHVTKDFSRDPDLLRATFASIGEWTGAPRSPDLRVDGAWNPFISCDWLDPDGKVMQHASDHKFEGDRNKTATFRVWMTAAQAIGLEAGHYPSSALPSIQSTFPADS